MGAWSIRSLTIWASVCQFPVRPANSKDSDGGDRQLSPFPFVDAGEEGGVVALGETGDDGCSVEVDGERSRWCSKGEITNGCNSPLLIIG